MSVNNAPEDATARDARFVRVRTLVGALAVLIVVVGVYLSRSRGELSLTATAPAIVKSSAAMPKMPRQDVMMTWMAASTP